MSALEAIAAVAEKVTSAAIEVGKKVAEVTIKETKEIAAQSIETAEKTTDAVVQKLGDIKSMSPEQLRELMEKILSERDSDSSTETDEGAKEREGLTDRNDTEHASASEETNEEGKELSEEEINAKQVEAIKSAFERIRNGETLTREELGNLGEMMMDQYYVSQGYTPLNKHRVTSIDDKKEGFKTGIDGVYEKTNPDGSKTYVIADAKYNNSQLTDTCDGKQMSDNWIDNRLDDAVGKEKADEIRDAAEDDPASVRHEIYHIEPTVDDNGNIHTDVQAVDSMGNKGGEKTIVEYYDKTGNRVNIDGNEDI